MGGAGGMQYVPPTEEERINDETGVKKQLKKHRKLKRKEAQKAAAGAEEEDAPESANALHALKRQRGENAWDFSDDEQFSDDDLGYCPDYDDQHTGLDAVTAPEGDEEAAIEGVDGEEPVGISLTDHGQELATLLRQQDGNDSLAADRQSTAAVGLGRAGESASSPTPAPAPPPAAPIVDIRERTITYLRQMGGKCSSKTFSEALGLKDKGSPLYNEVVRVLKEVADTEKLPGESRSVLRLKPEFAALVAPHSI